MLSRKASPIEPCEQLKRANKQDRFCCMAAENGLRAAGLIWTSPWSRFNGQIDLIQQLCRLVSLFFKGAKECGRRKQGLMYPCLRYVKSRLLSLDGGPWRNNEDRFLNVQKVSVDGNWNKDAYAGSLCLWDEIHVEFQMGFEFGQLLWASLLPPSCILLYPATHFCNVGYSPSAGV